MLSLCPHNRKRYCQSCGMPTKLNSFLLVITDLWQAVFGKGW